MLENNRKVARFVRHISWDGIPPEVQKQAKLCTLDILGAIIAGSETKVAGIMTRLAVRYWMGQEATILPSGCRANLPGAVLANAFIANALDIDDGYRPIKGHPGAVVFPAVLAAAESSRATGADFLAALVAAYEVALRAGLAWHHYHQEYHGSGSWGALGAAAGTANLFRLSETEIVHALGAAEYHAPMVEMMRCIDYPAMTKDGIGWGAMVGIMSTLMAKEGFTGIPSLLGLPEYEDLVNSLGSEYKILDLYFKPFACCRWGQPAVTGALQLRQEYGLAPADVRQVVVRTFKEAAQLPQEHPRDTEAAQYSLVYPVAAALVAGEVGPRQVLDENLDNPTILELAKKIRVVPDAEFDREFPAKCRCEIKITLKDGREISSGVTGSLGDFDNPLGSEGIEKKFRWLAGHVLPVDQVEAIRQAVWNLEQMDIQSFIQLIKLRQSC